MLKYLIFVGLIFYNSLLFGQTIDRAILIEKAKSSIVWIHSFGWPTFVGHGDYSTATGYVVENDLIITNYHAIKNATGISLYGGLNEDNLSYAYPVWYDSTLDLAILKTIDKITLPALEIAEMNEVKIGDDILVLGFPGSSYKPGSIKATRGIISSSPEDSTVQIDASVNPGNSGGPCINNVGKVVGTVFSKDVGLEIEGTGYLRNVRFIEEAIRNVKKTSDDETIRTYVGTNNIAAYRNFCHAQQLLWQAGFTNNTTEKRQKIDQAKSILFSSIDQDRNYVNARYFLASFFLEEALTYCLDGLDDMANSSAKNFEIEIKKAIEIKPSLEYNENTKMMRGFVYDGKIKCEILRDYLTEIESITEEKSERILEIVQYINDGIVPKILKKTLQGSDPYTYTSTSTSELYVDSEEKPQTQFENIIDYISPTISYSFIFFGKPLFSDGEDASMTNFEISGHTWEGVRLNWGMFIPKAGDNVGYLGITFRMLFAKFSYNLDDMQLSIPSWIAGFHFSEVDLALGQERVAVTIDEFPYYNFENTLFAHLKYEFSIAEPVWLHLLGYYPFKNGSEYYQIGAGLALHFY